MQILIEGWQKIGPGRNPAGVHFATNDVQIFYVNAQGRLEARSASTPMGEWADLTFGPPVLAASDKNVTHMTLKSFPRFGVYGVWWSDDRHRFAIYEYETDITEYLEDGTISSVIDSPVVTMKARFSNPDGAFIGEDEGILTPGSRLVCMFRIGDSAPFEMGTFYTDRSEYEVTEGEVDITSRNTIGKVLKDSTFDEDNTYPPELLSEVIKKMLMSAGIPENKFKVETASGDRGMSFPPDMHYLEGFESLFETANDWKMNELMDGTIVVGKPGYEHLPTPGKYTFYRDEDIFSRSVTRDDAESYSKVCVRSELTEYGTGTVKVSTVLNVRAEPNTTSTIIGTLADGTVVDILLESGNGWLEIQSGTLRGFVSGKYVTWTKQEPTTIYSYAAVPYDEGWGLPTHKTMYVWAAQNTSQAELDTYAANLAEKVSYSGVIETFVGPIMPHLQNGDEAEIISDTGKRLLGAITQVEHPFGKSGFLTEFTVDSGDIAGKGRVRDYITKIAGKQKPASGVTRLYHDV